MKNNCIPLLFFLGAVCSLWAQSVDLDKQYFEVAYVKLPTQPILNDANRTFSVQSLSSESLTQSLSKYYIESEVSIPGFTKFENDAFLTIEVKLQDVIVTSSTIEKRTSSTKKKDGTTTTTNYYKAVIKYRTQGSVKITSADNTINETLSFNGDKAISSKESTNYKNAVNFKNANTTQSIRIDFLNAAIRSINKQLSEWYGYPEVKYKDHLWVLDSRKHPENELHTANYERIKNTLAKMTPSVPVDALITEVDPAVTYFESIISKYPGKDRKSRKLKYASYYNLAVLHYYLDNPEKCIEYAEKLIRNDFDERDGKRLKEKANILKARFENNELDNRHFEVVTEDKTKYFEAMAAAEKEAAEPKEERPPSEDPNYSLSYLITKTSDTISGYIDMRTASNLKQNVRVFIKDMQGKEVARSFRAYEVETLLLGNGERYTTVAFKPSESISLSKSDAEVSFVKAIYTSDKLALYSYKNSELIIKKLASNQGASTASAGWMLGFRKKLSKLVDDCPSLVKRVKDKEFANNAQSLTEFIKAYENCK